MPKLKYIGPFATITVRDPQVSPDTFVRDVPVEVSNDHAEALLKQEGFVVVKEKSAAKKGGE